MHQASKSEQMRCEIVITMLEEASDRNESRQSGNKVVDIFVRGTEAKPHGSVVPEDAKRAKLHLS